jgi:hypothetical protein
VTHGGLRLISNSGREKNSGLVPIVGGAADRLLLETRHGFG